MRRQFLILLCALCGIMPLAGAKVSARDDAGNNVVLPQPAKRVVSLAPHATELLFAAGGGDRVVGVVSHSDYPAAAQQLPRVGDHHRIDIERLLALQPDLLVVWRHGAAARQLEALRRLGIPIYFSEPRRLDDIPRSLEQLGRLLGTGNTAQARAAELRSQLRRLAADYGGRPKVSVFYQVWERPLYTLSGRHIVSDAIRLCGGTNVFANLATTAPVVTVEAVLLENPQAIISANERDRQGAGLAHWKQYPSLAAVRQGNLFSLDADLINRSGPRMIEGTAQLCEKLEQARKSHREPAPGQRKAIP